METEEAFLLGLVQGLTEFLPVSSSGHIELGKIILGIHFQENLLFSVVLHLATALSTLWVFRKQIAEIFCGLFASPYNKSQHFAALIAISMLPVFILGVFFKDTIASFFDGNLLLVGLALLFTGLLLLFAHYPSRRQADKKLGFWEATLIGIAQAVAVIPGISRSGSTIATALLLGIRREEAARFSFLMVIPPILGAALLSLKDYLKTAPTAQTIDLLPLLVGFLTAFLTGILACRWMIRIVKQGKLLYFAIYCFLAGTAAVTYALY